MDIIMIYDILNIMIRMCVITLLCEVIVTWEK